jgi:hemoglobin
MSNTEQTLFDKYGGVPVVSALVGAFYERVLLEPTLAPYFDGVEMPALVDHQVAFMRFVMGKPSEIFTSERMAIAHQKFKITQADFDRTVVLLTRVLEEGGVVPDDLNLVVQRVAHFADDIIYRG